MSHDATNWAIKQRGLKPAPKIVLWQLCDRFHPDNGCFPSQKTLAEDCEMSRSALNGHLDTLEKVNLIRRIVTKSPTSKQQQKTRYLLRLHDDFETSKHTDAMAFGPCPENEHGPVSGNPGEPCPENNESRVRNPDSNSVREPVREPVKDSRENARARGVAEFAPKPSLNLRPAEDEPREAAFRRLVQAYPPAAIDDEQKARREWGDVDEADWQAAVDAIPRYLRGRKDIRRATIVGLEKYIRDRKWTGFPQPASAVASAEPSVELKPYVVPLWALLWGVIDPAGQKHSGKIEYFLSRLDKGLVTPASAIPKADDAAPLVPIKIGSAEHTAWVSHCEKLGFRLPKPDAVPVVYVPTEIPPALKSSWKGYKLALPQRLMFRSRAWWWRLHQIGDGSIIESQLREASRSHGSVTVDVGPWPSAAALAGMVEIVRMSDAWHAWAKWFDTKGVFLDLWPEASIWCPSEYPPMSVASTKELAT